jgi:hypothetical protein
MTGAGATATRLNGLTPASRGTRSLAAGVVTFLLWASLISLFAISNLMLARFGFAYETSGGAAWQKIAPSTYLAVLGMALYIVTRPDLAAWLDDVVKRHKGLIVFFAAFLLLFFYIVKFQGAPLTATFDTFLAPMALFLLINARSEKSKRRMALFLHIFMAVNALLGLAEFAIGFRLTPIVAQNIEITSDYRSSALLGHPLNNAAVASVYAFILMIGGGRDLTPGWRTIALLLQLPALAVFGGRFATVAFVGFGGAVALWGFAQILAGRRFSRLAAATALALIPVAVVSIILLVSEGFLDKFLMRFVDDQGSAASRLVMFDLVGDIPFHDLLIGADPQIVATMQRTYGIAFGIESFWVGFIAYYGILVSVPFFVGLIAFLADLRRQTIPGAVWASVLYILICSTSASLSGKTTGFGQFLVLAMLLLRPAVQSQAARMVRR